MLGWVTQHTIRPLHAGKLAWRTLCKLSPAIAHAQRSAPASAALIPLHWRQNAICASWACSRFIKCQTLLSVPTSVDDVFTCKLLTIELAHASNIMTSQQPAEATSYLPEHDIMVCVVQSSTAATRRMWAWAHMLATTSPLPSSSHSPKPSAQVRSPFLSTALIHTGCTVVKSDKLAPLICPVAACAMLLQGWLVSSCWV